jgi:hypothetical protein
MKGIGQRGQAMVEMTVMFGVIVMMFLGILYLGKYHDVQATTIQSARYAAWERTVHSTSAMGDSVLQNQARARLFTWNKNAFKNTDGAANGSAWSTQNAVWRDHAGGNRLVDRPDDVTIGTSVGPLAGRAAGTIAKATGTLTKALDVLTGGEPLPPGGTATGTVSVKLNNMAKLPAPLDALNLTLRESHSVVFEAWDARDPKQAAMRSRTFTVAGPLTKINSLLSPAEWALSWLEPSFKDLHLGQVCPDVIPQDRVSGGSNLPVYQGGGACVR